MYAKIHVVTFDYFSYLKYINKEFNIYKIAVVINDYILVFEKIKKIPSKMTTF